MSRLSNCPICGAKTYVDRDEPDGFFLGYSVGCPRYKLNDGIHNNRMAFHNISTKERAIMMWNEFCERMLGK